MISTFLSAAATARLKGTVNTRQLRNLYPKTELFNVGGYFKYFCDLYVLLASCWT
jgi:hypothetical protein